MGELSVLWEHVLSLLACRASVVTCRVSESLRCPALQMLEVWALKNQEPAQLLCVCSSCKQTFQAEWNSNFLIVAFCGYNKVV